MKTKLFALILLACTLTFGQSAKMWVFFTDKAIGSTATDTLTAFENAKQKLTPRALNRRAKVLLPSKIIGICDIPISEHYCVNVENLGAQIVHKCKWLNAISVIATPDVIENLRKLPFVAKVQPVAVFHKRFDESATLESADFDSAFYGYTAVQIASMNVPQLHRMGVSGAGVLLCVTDTGFNLRHNAVAHADVVAHYDFVSGDSIVWWQEGDNPSVTSHGTKCWGEIAGNLQHVYYGVAPNASFVLARTENLDSETTLEEDSWAAATEWAESLGVDIISVSLGYDDWYVPANFDGDTPVITRAADLAAMHGISVFVAAGNDGRDGRVSISAPSDGDSVLAVGACDNNGVLASFSSRGPSADGRIKPDFVAHGANTWCLSGYDDSTYVTASGTSMATPNAAGVGALLLEMKPSLTPMQLRETLRKSANNAATPNNDYGWGVIDARAAAAYPANDTSIVIFNAGWNFFALPVGGEVLVASVPEILSAFEFDGTALIPAAVFRAGRGYAVLVASDAKITFTGPRVLACNVPLLRGWNFIGGLSRRTFWHDFDNAHFSHELFVLRNGVFCPATSLAPAEAGWFFSLSARTAVLSDI